MSVLKKISLFTSKHIAFIMMAIAFFALFFPQGFKNFQPIWINPLLGVVMFGMGLTIRPNDFLLVLKQPKAVVLGIILQFTVMSLLAFVLVRLFNLPKEIAIGVALVGAVPGGTSSNVMTFLAKGDVALSVIMTSISTLLSPFITPVIARLLLGTSIQVDMMRMFISIAQIVILPILLGFIVTRLLGKYVQHIVSILPLISIAAIGVIIAIVVSRNATQVLNSGLLIIGIVLLHNVLGYLFGYMIARLITKNPAKQATIAIETGMQNAGLATALAHTHFLTSPLATVPGVIYSVLQLVTGSIFANLMKVKENDSE